jgi:hypothetical protein
MKRPQLVDPNWFKKPEPKILKNTPKLTLRVSDYLNFIAICGLIIGSFLLYERYKKKDLILLEKQNSVIQFHQSIKEKLEVK